MQVQRIEEDTQLDGMPKVNDVAVTTPPPKHQIWNSPESGDKVSPPVAPVDFLDSFGYYPHGLQIGGRYFSKAKRYESSDEEESGEEAAPPTELDSDGESEKEEGNGYLAAGPYSYSDAEESEEGGGMEVEDTEPPLAPVLHDGYTLEMEEVPMEEVPMEEVEDTSLFELIVCFKRHFNRMFVCWCFSIVKSYKAYCSIYSSYML